MIELCRTGDPVMLSWLESRLAQDGIASVTLDAFTSNAFAGTLDSVARRVMVAEADLARARKILDEGRELGRRA
jgi:hypothetical protein